MRIKTQLLVALSTLAVLSCCPLSCVLLPFISPDNPRPKKATQPKKIVKPLGPTEGSLIVAAREYVRLSLKSPRSAKFPSMFTMKVLSLGDDNYRVTGYVDARNDFGEMVRGRWTVEIHAEQGTDKMDVTDISID